MKLSFEYEYFVSVTKLLRCQRDHRTARVGFISFPILAAAFLAKPFYLPDDVLQLDSVMRRSRLHELLNDTDFIDPPLCVNCKGAHPAFDRRCPKCIFEKAVVAVKTKNKLSFREACW